MVEPEEALPSPGDAVSVKWGHANVIGRVVESYSGVRPRVVVEIEPHQIGDEAMSVTVPVHALTPTKGASSSWAVAARYEIAVGLAIERVLSNRLRLIEVGKPSGDSELDLVATLKDGRKLIFETKAYVPDRVRLRRIYERIERLAYAERSHGIIVIPGQTTLAPKAGSRSRVAIVTWRDEKDDQELAAAIDRLHSSSE
jgi:hypothetical protein